MVALTSQLLKFLTHSSIFHNIFSCQLVCSNLGMVALTFQLLQFLTSSNCCLPILKSPNSSRASLERYLVSKSNRIAVTNSIYVFTPLPDFTLLVSPWSACTLTLLSMCSLLSTCLLLQQILVFSWVCINFPVLYKYVQVALIFLEYLACDVSVY